MIYNRLKRFSLSTLVIAACLLLASCGSDSSDAKKQLKTKADLQGAVIGVQLGTTSDSTRHRVGKER